MRKMVFGRHLSRGRKSREALFRSLIRALVLSGKIITTKAKAKAVQGQIDKTITIAKEKSVSARKRVLAFMANNRKIADAICGRIVDATGSRNSGYTRIINLPERVGDRAKMVRLEWTDEIKKVEKVRKVGQAGKTVDKKKKDVKEKPSKPEKSISEKKKGVSK